MRNGCNAIACGNMSIHSYAQAQISVSVFALVESRGGG